MEHPKISSAYYKGFGPAVNFIKLTRGNRRMLLSARSLKGSEDMDIKGRIHSGETMGTVDGLALDIYLCRAVP